MHDQITHGTLFNSFGHSWFRATSCTLRFYLDARGTDPKNADHALAEFDAAVRAILRQEAYGKQDC